MDDAAAVQRLHAGIDTMARPLAMSLGPGSGHVLCAVGGAAEVVRSAALLTERVTGLADASADVGAMMLREMCTAVRRRFGDGSATAAVLARAMVGRVLLARTAGVDPVRMRVGIELGARVADRCLAEQTSTVDDRELICQLALAATGDEVVATLVAEMFDVLGPDGALVVEDRPGLGLDHHFIEGSWFVATPAIDELVPPTHSELTAADANVVCVDGPIADVRDIAAVLELAATGTALLVLAREYGDEALATLRHNGARGPVIAAMECAGGEVGEDIEDLALLCGARPVRPAAGDRVRELRPHDAGRVRRLTVGRRGFGLRGTGGDPAVIDQRAAALFARATELDTGDEEWRSVRLRAARLRGAVGTVRLGSAVDADRDASEERIRVAERVVAQALRGGVVPGGGVALFDCRAALDEAAGDCADRDVAAGIEVVAAAVEAPLRQLVHNDGRLSVAAAVHGCRTSGPGHGYDVRTGSVTRLAVHDGADVVRGALGAAASLAGSVSSTARIVRARA